MNLCIVVNFYSAVRAIEHGSSFNIIFYVNRGAEWFVDVEEVDE